MQQNETTFIMIKPDGVEKKLTGEILRRFEQRDLVISNIAYRTITREIFEFLYPHTSETKQRMGKKVIQSYKELAHYGYSLLDDMGTETEEELGQIVLDRLWMYLTRGPVVVATLSGIHAVDIVRKIVGNTIPFTADMGTIRGDFSNDSSALANHEGRALENIIHASASAKEAYDEIQLWFPESE